MECKQYMLNDYGSSCRHTGAYFPWMDERGPLELFCFNCLKNHLIYISSSVMLRKNESLQLKEEFCVEQSTHIYIDCLSSFACSSYCSMRWVVYGGITDFILLMVCSCNSVP